MWTLVVPLAVVCIGSLAWAHFNALSFFTHESDEEDSQCPRP